MAYLGIDTSTHTLCLGLYSDNLNKTLELSVERDHSKRFIVELEGFLDQQGLSKADLQGVGVGIGPGSYTGIRVGIASASGLARALGLKLTGVSSLEAMATTCLKENEQAIVTMDARKDNVYYGLFTLKNNQIALTTELSKDTVKNLKLTYPDVQVYEGLTPNAAYIAKQAMELPASSIEAIYL